MGTGISWKPTQDDTDTITSSEWNDFAQCLLNVSGNAIPFSANARTLYAGSAQSKQKYRPSTGNWGYVSSTRIKATRISSQWYSGNRLYAYQISCAIFKGPGGAGGSATLAGAMTGDIFGARLYGMSGLKFLSSQIITVGSLSGEDAILKFRDNDGDNYGFTFKYSSLGTGAGDRDLYIIRHNGSVAGTNLARLERNTNNIYLFGSLSSQVVSGNLVRINRLVQGFQTPSASVYIQSGLTVGRRTKWGQWCGILNVILDPSDGYGYRQALVLYADKDNVQGGKLYGVNATAMGNNAENIALYGYAAEGTSKNWGLLIDAGNAYIRENLSSQSISSAKIVNKGYLSSNKISTNSLYGYTISCHTWKGPTIGGGSGTPGGSDTQVQYNNAGAFGGDSGFTYIAGTNTINLAGSLSSQVISSGRITNLHLPYDYVVYRLNGKYFNKRGSDGLIYSHEYANNVIQNAIDGCGGKGGRIAIMSGNYYLIDNINIIDSSIILEGTGIGWDGTIGVDDAMNVKLTARNDSNLDPIIGKYMISCSYNGAAGTCIMGIQIRGLSIWGNQQQGVKGGIVGANLQHSVFENLWIGDFWGTGNSSIIYPRSGIGLMLKGPQAGGCYYNEVRNVEFRRCTTGLFLSGNCNANQISNCHWDGGDRSTNNSRMYGIFFNGAASNTFIGPNDIDDYTGSNHYAIYISGNEVSEENATLNTFFGQRLEGNYHNIYIANRSHGSNWFLGGMCYSSVPNAVYWEDNETNNPSYTRDMDGIPDKGIRSFVSANALYGYTISCNTWKGPTIGGGGISNVVEDTTPQLGGDLDGNTHGIVSLTYLSSNAISSGRIKNMHYPVDYVIWRSGSTVYSKRGTDGYIYKKTIAAGTGVGAEDVIQNAIDNCPAYGGRIVLMSGAYDIRDNIRIYKAITLEGASIGAGTTKPNVKLYYPLGGMGYPIERGKYMISCSRYALGDIIQGVVIRNMFISPNQNGYVRGGIIAREAQHCIFENIFFNDFFGSSSGPTPFDNLYPRSGIGIMLVGNDAVSGYGNYYNIVRDCEFRRCTVGLMVSGNSNAHTFSNNHFNGGHRGKYIGGMSIYGIFNWAGDTCAVIGSGDFEDYSGQNCYAVYMASGVGGSGWNFFGQRFEGNVHDVWISYSTYDGYHKFFGGSMNDTSVGHRCPTFASYTDKFLNTDRDSMRSYVRYVNGLPNSGKDSFVSSQKFSSSSIKGKTVTIVGSTTSPGYLSSNRISSNRIHAYTISCNTWLGPTIGGGGGSPGGSDTYIQFNDGGSSFGGDDALTWNKTTNTMRLQGALSSNSISSSRYTNLWMPYNYIITRQGGNYLAVRGSDRNISYTSTVAKDVIQYALNNSISGTVKLMTDVEDLEGTISGTKCLFDLGHHEIRIRTRAFNVFKVYFGFSLINGAVTIDNTPALQSAYSGLAILYFNPKQAGANWGWAGAYHRMYYRDLWLRNDYNGAGGYQPNAVNSGSAMFFWISGHQAFHQFHFDNIHVDNMWYGVRVKVEESDTADTYFNGNFFNQLHGNSCKRFIDLRAFYHPERGYGNAVGLSHNFFIGYDIQTQPWSEKSIYCEGGGNYFEGITWDPTAGLTLTEFHKSSSGNYVADASETGSWYGMFTATDSLTKDYGKHNTFFDRSYAKYFTETLFVNNIYGRNWSGMRGDSLEFHIGTGSTATNAYKMYSFALDHKTDINRMQIDNFTDYTYITHYSNTGNPVGHVLSDGTNSWRNIMDATGRMSFMSYPYPGWGAVVGIEKNCQFDSLWITSGHSTKRGEIGINTSTPTHALQVAKGGIFSPGISSQGNISGQYRTPMFRGTGKPDLTTDGPLWEGKIVRTSGSLNGADTTAQKKSYVWMCVRNSTGTYEWIQLGIST